MSIEEDIMQELQLRDEIVEIKEEILPFELNNLKEEADDLNRYQSCADLTECLSVTEWGANNTTECSAAEEFLQ